MLRDAPSDSFLPACPGAGKTFQVVDRFLAVTSNQSRRGVAMVSFSNSAVDEVRTRCGPRSDALAHPNFVGTFDSFIHRFITTPYFAALGQKVRYVDDWRQIDNSTIRLSGADSSVGFPLEWFTFDHEGAASLDLDRPLAGLRQSHRNLAASKSRQLCSIAKRRRRALMRSGIVSCSAARSLAMELLADDDSRSRFGARLRGRFAEVIVDEMQDCGPEELAVLELCREVGVPLVLVADMDQSIYEWRNAVPEDVSAFVATLTQLPGLMDNRRSTAAICGINTSLRYGRAPESPILNSSSVPVHVRIDDDPASARAWFRETVEALGLSLSDAIVLAHRTTDALSVGGRRVNQSNTSDRVALAAGAVAVLRDVSATPRQRLLARDQLGDTMLTLVGVDDDGLLVERLDGAGIDGRWFKRLIARVSSELRGPLAEGRNQFTQALRDQMTGVSWPNNLQLSPGSMRTPRQTSWDALSLGGEADDALQASTVHGVKGQEFGAVLLVLPRRLRADGNGETALDHWEMDRATEQRRVLYVGASRPKDLLGLLVPSASKEQVVRVLEATSVDFVVSDG